MENKNIHRNKLKCVAMRIVSIGYLFVIVWKFSSYFISLVAPRCLLYACLIHWPLAFTIRKHIIWKAFYILIVIVHAAWPTLMYIVRVWLVRRWRVSRHDLVACVHQSPFFFCLFLFLPFTVEHCGRIRTGRAHINICIIPQKCSLEPDFSIYN